MHRAPYTSASKRYGANYIAGGPGDNMIFGGQGTNTIQGAGSILGALNPPTLTPGVSGLVLALTPFTTTYSLTFNGQVIDGISSTATAAMLQIAIRALSGLSSVTVSGNVGGPYTISRLGSASYSVNSKVYAYRDPTIQEQVAPGQVTTALGLSHINPSFEAATDGNNYIEGGGGNGSVIFGDTGQNDIIGGNSTCSA